MPLAFVDKRAVWDAPRVLHDLALEGHGTRLVPLDLPHAEALAAFVDARVWAGMSSALPEGVAAWRDQIAAAREAPGRRGSAALAAATGEVRGSTSFYDWEPRVRRVEIGHTFFAPRWWGTSNNPACKLLMLEHAFGTWGCARVALRADTRNSRSVAAITRLGAVPEGVLRNHRLAPDGTRGDTAYFSILPAEWPGVRAGLLARLGAA
jgi:RimJ/RimL family protein N-acetyltransferase